MKQKEVALKEKEELQIKIDDLQQKLKLSTITQSGMCVYMYMHVVWYSRGYSILIINFKDTHDFLSYTPFYNFIIRTSSATERRD